MCAIRPTSWKRSLLVCQVKKMILGLFLLGTGSSHFVVDMIGASSLESSPLTAHPWEYAPEEIPI